MFPLETYQLTHPELLSKADLSEVLKNCCIEKLNFNAMTKPELIEIYKKIALPLPQRGCNAKNTQEEQVDNPFKFNYINRPNKNNKRSLHINSLSTDAKRVLLNGQQDRLKPPIDQSTSVDRIVKLPTVQNFHTSDNTHKRKQEETNKDSVLPQVRKRQKITWP